MNKNFSLRRALALALSSVLLFLSSCGDSNGGIIGGGIIGGGTNGGQNLLSLQLTPNTQSILACGFQQQFTVTGTFSDGSEQDLSSLVTWASSDTAAATISDSGLLTTVLPGNTTVSAELNTLRAELPIDVTSSPTPLLQGPTGILFDDRPEGLASGDFNADGIPDLAVGFDIRAEVQVLFGQANGEFQPGPRVSSGGTTFSAVSMIVASDVNGADGLDLLVLNTNQARLTVMLNDGSGVFSLGQTLSLGLTPGHLSTADFDGQNGPDIVVTDRNSQDFRVFLNNGDGTFSGPSTTSVELARQSFAGDLDGQNGPDLAVVNGSDNRIEIYLNQGDGTFAAPVFVATAARPTSIIGGDFNGQNGIDLAVGNEDASVTSIQLFSNQGGGNFSLSGTLDNVGPVITSLNTADIDGVNGLDLIASDRSNNGLHVFLNDGQGSFGTGTYLATGRAPTATQLLDLNGDGSLDIVSNTSSQDYITIFYNQGQGQFPVGNLEVAGQSNVVRFADLDGMNGEDLVVADHAAQVIRIGLNDGNGNFPTKNSFPVGDFSDQIEIRDLDGQNGLDIVAMSGGDDSVRVFLNQGGGGFGPQTELPVGDNPRDMNLADLDGQNGPDIITANRFDDTISLLMNQGDGTFVAAPVLNTRDRPEELVVIDLDGDDRPEIIVGGQSDNFLEIYENQGNGTFAPPISIRFPSPPSRLLETGDFDGVNGPDIVVGVSQPNRSLITLLNQGDGTLVESHNMVTGISYGPHSLVTDFNCDGVLDLFVSHTSSIFLGQGDGSFDTPVNYGIDSDSPALADLDGDGLFEMYLAGGDNFGLTILNGGEFLTP